MIAPELLALVVAPLLGAPVYSAALGARAELRLRSPGDVAVDGRTSDRSFDTDLSATARMLARFRRTEFAIGYLPRLTFRDFTGLQTTDVLHGAEASASWRASRRVRLSLRESASYGDRYFSPLAGTGADTGRPISPSAQAALEGSVSYVSTDTVLSSGLTLSRRSNLELATSYFVNGGADRASREVLPLISGARAGGVWSYALRRIDTLSTDVETSYQRTRATSQLASIRTFTLVATEGWTRRWSRRTRSNLAAGVGVARSSPTEEGWFVFPSGAASLNHRIVTDSEHGTLELIGTAEVEGTVDQLTGQADPRFRAAARLVQTLDPVTIYAEVSRTVSLRESPSELRLTAAEGGAELELTKALSLESGVRVVDQSFAAGAPPLATSGLNWAVFIALELRFGPRPIRYFTR